MRRILIMLQIMAFCGILSFAGDYGRQGNGTTADKIYYSTALASIPLTVCCWAKRLSISTPVAGFLMGDNSVWGTGTNMFALEIVKSGVNWNGLNFEWAAAAGGSGQKAGVWEGLEYTNYYLEYNKWVFIACTREEPGYPGNSKMYIGYDNVPAEGIVAPALTTFGSRVPDNSFSASSQKFQILSDGAGYFNGVIDDVYVFNRVLSLGEIRNQQYNPGSVAYENCIYGTRMAERNNTPRSESVYTRNVNATVTGTISVPGSPSR